MPDFDPLGYLYNLVPTKPFDPNELSNPATKLNTLQGAQGRPADWQRLIQIADEDARARQARAQGGGLANMLMQTYSGSIPKAGG